VTGFRVVGETTRAEAGFLTLADVEIVDDRGERLIRHVVRHPGAVMVVPVLDDREHVLMVRQFRAAAGRELLEIPAGKRDVPGEPPEDTARRELEEEIGRRPQRLVELCECYMSPGFTDEYAHVYCALDLVDLGANAAATHEEAAMTVEEVALADVEELIASREVVDAKTIIGLLLARRFLADEPAATRGG
jgi:ADP-ribose pyrophosphatase